LSLADGSGLREFVGAYVVEAEEHVETASRQLLAIESAAASGQPNLRAIREAFRALHTIKGLSAMVGVEQVVTIAHRMEALLRTADRRGAMLPAATVDVLLDALKAIRERVRAFGEGNSVEPPGADLLRALDELDADYTAVAPDLASFQLPPALAAKLGALELDQLKAGVLTGKRALRVEFEPSLEKSGAGVTINHVRERAEAIGEVVKIFPNASAAGLSFVIVLLTAATDAEVAAATCVDVASIELLAHGAAPVPLDVAQQLAEVVSSGDPSLEEISMPQRTMVRVDVGRLDDTVEGLSALIVTRFRLGRAVRALRERGIDVRELEEIVAENARQLRTLRAAILRVRMVPVSELLERIPLIVRSLLRSMNRQVRLELEGGGAEVDKAVAERLFPALVHLIRNAVDHAIETPDERLRRGKPEQGLVRIECVSQANRWLQLRVIDDGRGVDAKAVAARAKRPPPQDDAALLELVCRSGLSTREVPTETSGRGVGMEIVKRIATEQLGGELSLSTELGVGTTFTLTVPLSISVVDAFTFSCAGQRFATPVGNIEEIIELDPAHVAENVSFSGRFPVRLVQRRGRSVPLVALADVLQLSHQVGDRRALVVRRGAELVAFGVERMLGQEEVVVRPLNDVLLKVPGVAGATDLGDGQPTLVLDLPALGNRISLRDKELSA